MKLFKKYQFSLCGAVSLLWIILIAPACLGNTTHEELNTRSVLILPPINQTKNLKATNAFLSQMIHPLSEAGYYVFPVLMELETFRQMGVSSPEDIAKISTQKLNSIFGADAVLYSTITDYDGGGFFNNTSETSITARMVNSKSGRLLWSGSAYANLSGSGRSKAIQEIILNASIGQIGNDETKAAYPLYVLATEASEKLLESGQRTGLVHGPRYPKVSVQTSN